MVILSTKRSGFTQFDDRYSENRGVVGASQVRKSNRYQTRQEIDNDEKNS